LLKLAFRLRLHAFLVDHDVLISHSVELRTMHANGVYVIYPHSEAIMGKIGRAKLFWSGRSQAVRLPKTFRFEGEEVSIRREGAAVILEPVPKRAWPAGYWESFGPVDDEFKVPDPLPPSQHRDTMLALH
jgi:antitoxin VapB